MNAKIVSHFVILWPAILLTCHYVDSVLLDQVNISKVVLSPAAWLTWHLEWDSSLITKCQNFVVCLLTLNSCLSINFYFLGCLHFKLTFLP